MSDRPVSVQRDEAGHWLALRAQPCPALRPFVVGCYVGWTESQASPVRRRELPVLMVPVILNFGAAFKISTGGQDDVTVSSFLAGAHHSFSLVGSAGRTECLQVNLTHDAAFRLLGSRMNELTDRVVGCGELLGAISEGLIEQLGNVRDWSSRFDILDRFLLARLLGRSGLSAAVRQTLAILDGTRGNAAIGDLAKVTGLSRKRLNQEVSRQVGLTPKALARMHRFDHAVRSLLAGPSGLAQIALEAGYYDQAHFNRDFRAFAGLAPLQCLQQRGLETGRRDVG